jgi:hypothetical protein
MPARFGVLLNPPKPSGLPQLPFYKHPAPVTSPESTLVEVLIPKTFKLPRINTYKKQGEGSSDPTRQSVLLVYPACPEPACAGRRSRRERCEGPRACLPSSGLACLRSLPAQAGQAESRGANEGIRLVSCPTLQPLGSSFYLSLLLSSPCALFCATAPRQHLSFHSLAHSFYRHGGVCPHSSSPKSSLVSLLSRTSRGCATPLQSTRCIQGDE